MDTVEVMYQSEGLAANGEPFLTVKRSRGYYEYSERAGRDSIAFILFDRSAMKLGLIYESKPSLDESLGELAMLTTAFGGSLDVDISPLEICQIEVREEAGYEVPLDRIHFVGYPLVSTQMSQRMHAYLVDVTDIPKTLPTEFEQPIGTTKDPLEFSRNRIIWMTPKEVMANDDWKSIYICARTLASDII